MYDVVCSAARKQVDAALAENVCRHQQTCWCLQTFSARASSRAHSRRARTQVNGGSVFIASRQRRCPGGRRGRGQGGQVGRGRVPACSRPPGCYGVRDCCLLTRLAHPPQRESGGAAPQRACAGGNAVSGARQLVEGRHTVHQLCCRSAGHGISAYIFCGHPKPVQGLHTFLPFLLGHSWHLWQSEGPCRQSQDSLRQSWH